MVFDKDKILKQLISGMCTYPMLKSLCSLVFYLPGGFSDSLNVVCTSSFPLERSSFSLSQPELSICCLHVAFHIFDWSKNSGWRHQGGGFSKKALVQFLNIPGRKCIRNNTRSYCHELSFVFAKGS